MFEFLRRAFMAFLAAGNAIAQSFPGRPVRLVVAFVPGASDTLARQILPELSRAFGQPAIVENR